MKRLVTHGLLKESVKKYQHKLKQAERKAALEAATTAEHSEWARKRGRGATVDTPRAAPQRPQPPCASQPSLLMTSRSARTARRRSAFPPRRHALSAQSRSAPRCTLAERLMWRAWRLKLNAPPSIMSRCVAYPVPSGCPHTWTAVKRLRWRVSPPRPRTSCATPQPSHPSTANSTRSASRPGIYIEPNRRPTTAATRCARDTELQHPRTRPPPPPP